MINFLDEAGLSPRKSGTSHRLAIETETVSRLRQNDSGEGTGAKAAGRDDTPKRDYLLQRGMARMVTEGGFTRMVNALG